MDLLVKCTVAVIIMIAIHDISKTKNFYISGMALSFPGLSMIAYYFMYLEHGAAKIRTTTSFAMLSLVPFAIFLLTFNFSIKKDNIVFSLAVSSAVWIVLSSALIIIWNKVKRI